MSRFGSSYAKQSDRRVRAVVGLSVILGLSVITSVAMLFARTEASTEVPPQVPAQAPLSEMASLLVARRDIEPGEALQPELFLSENRPADQRLRRYVSSNEQIQGQFARSLILAGEPMPLKMMSATRSGSPLSPTIPEGVRLVTIRVNDITSVDGFVRPGELVDVAWIHPRNGSLALKVIVENARVVAADRNLDQSWKPSMPVPGTVTLQVPVRESRVIQLCSQAGTLSLALRGADGKSGPNDELTMQEIDAAQQTSNTPQHCRGRLKMRDGGAVTSWCVTDGGELVPAESPAMAEG